MDIPFGCMGIPPQFVRGPCAAGQDIRPGSYDLAIGDCIIGSRGLVVPRLVFYGKVRNAEESTFIMRQYRVLMALCDSRPDAEMAIRQQRKCRDLGMHFWRAQYNTAPMIKEWTEDTTNMILTLERTVTLDQVLHGVQTQLGLVIPQNFRDICNADFAQEMTASTRVPTVWHGRPWYQWQDIGADHAFHAVNYMLSIMRFGKMLLTGNEATMGVTRGIVEGTLGNNLDDDDDPFDGLTNDRNALVGGWT